MIYFIQAGDTGPIKIGKGNDPERRLRELQTGAYVRLHLRAILDVEDGVEQHFHEILESCRTLGEWFRGDELIVNIAMACAMAGQVWEPFCCGCGQQTKLNVARRFAARGRD